MDKLCYYSKSRNVPVGKGSNEYVKDPSEYKELDAIPNWRRVLSNFYTEPFTFQGKTYNSVEHAFQSSKIRLVCPEKADYFILESKHLIGTSDGSVAQKNRKIVILNEEQLKQWDMIKEDLMTEITIQRILQSSFYKKVLLLTGKAELWHVVVRKGVVRNKYLEDLRDKFTIF